MKKRTMLVMAALVVVMSLITTVPAAACTQGCTPGYWKQKQHFDSWVGYAPTDNFNTVFGVGPDITLLEALKAKGGGENAFLRHAVAALLNEQALENWSEPGWVQRVVDLAYHPDGDFEYRKDQFARFNELGCPLD